MAGNWFPPAELTGSGRPVLHSGEFESSLLSSVDLSCDDNPSFSLLKSGLLVLTAHRLIWIDQSSSASSAVAASVPLAAVIRIFSPHKSIKSMFSSPRIRVQVTATPEGLVKEGGPRSVVITFTVRGKSDIDSFLTKLWEAWRGRAWESTRVSGSGSGGGRGSTADETGGPSFEIKMPIVGVSGILRKEQEMWESTDKNLQDAFKDLNALMSKAKEMVMLAEKMRIKLLSSSNNQASTTNDEEMGSKQEMQDWLLSIGVASPVTKETAGALYHQQLARQLADFVKIPLERAGGVINLIDVYCLFNRARGTELISPEDLLQACSIWEKFDIPVMLRRFDSGVFVIQNKSHSDEEVFSRLKSLVLNPDVLQMGISASDAARALGIAPAMAKEHLLSAESKGLLCRDVSPDGFRFYINLFNEIDTDDPHRVRDHGVYAAWVNAAIASR